jgi:hypothetical protein
MKQFLKNSVLFSFLAVISYLIILILWVTFFPQSFQKNLRYGLSTGNLNERLIEADTVTKVDVLIIGSSHAYRGYDTRIFKEKGIIAFNLGSSAQTPIQSKLMIEQYIDKMKPKLILYDIYPEVFCLDGVESNLDFISNFGKIESSLIRQSIKTKNIKVYNTLFYSLFQRYTNFLPFFEKKIVNDKSNYISGGYVQTLNSSKPKTDYEATKNNMLPYQLDAFCETLKLLDKKNIPFILVQSPLRKNFYNSITNNNEVDTFFRSKGNYFNFNELISIDDDFYADERHLNQKGVTYFNSDLLTRINFDKYLKK